MTKFFKNHFKNGVTKIPKELERVFFFYATMVMVVFYLINRFFGDAWFK